MCNSCMMTLCCTHMHHVINVYSAIFSLVGPGRYIINGFLLSLHYIYHQGFMFLMKWHCGAFLLHKTFSVKNGASWYVLPSFYTVLISMAFVTALSLILLAFAGGWCNLSGISWSLSVLVLSIALPCVIFFVSSRQDIMLVVLMRFIFMEFLYF